MHFFSITKIQGRGLHYIMLMLGNRYSYFLKMLLYISPRSVLKDKNECIGDERLHHPLSFAIFASLTTYS